MSTEAHRCLQGPAGDHRVLTAPHGSPQIHRDPHRSPQIPTDPHVSHPAGPVVLAQTCSPKTPQDGTALKFSSGPVQSSWEFPQTIANTGNKTHFVGIISVSKFPKWPKSELQYLPKSTIRENIKIVLLPSLVPPIQLPPLRNFTKVLYLGRGHVWEEEDAFGKRYAKYKIGNTSVYD
ncbi:hypothetical protein HOY80DRAFT_1036926 [Tuber brumale]|nr:hypothetical protein HOY80DRAFT_1036926 [Tuber brumale]